MGSSYIAAKNTVDAKGWSKKGIGHQTKQHELIYILRPSLDSLKP